MRVKFSLNHCQSGGTEFYLTNYYLFDFMGIGCLILLFLGHRNLIKNKTQTAVINILNLHIMT